MTQRSAAVIRNSTSFPTHKTKVQEIKQWGKMLVKITIFTNRLIRTGPILLKLCWRNSFFDRGTSRLKLASAQVNRGRLQTFKNHEPMGRLISKIVSSKKVHESQRIFTCNPMLDILLRDENCAQVALVNAYMSSSFPELGKPGRVVIWLEDRSLLKC